MGQLRAGMVKTIYFWPKSGAHMFSKMDTGISDPVYPAGYLRGISQKGDTIHCMKNRQQLVTDAFIGGLKVILIN